MDKLAALVALIALGGVAWVAFGQESEGSSDDVSQQMEQIRAEQASLSEKLDRLLAARQPELMSGSGGGMAPIDGAPGLEPGAPTAVAEGAPTAIDTRVADLEVRLRKQDEEMAALKKKGVRSFSPFGKKRFFRSADDAAKALELSDAQKSDMERVLDSAKHELERLYDTQNEDGQTLSALQKKMADEVKNRKSNEPFASVLTHITAMQKFKQSKVPGSDETYAQAERRVNKRAMDDIRRDLSPEQQKEWDNSHTGGLLPGGGGTTVSTMVVGEPGMFGGSIEIGGK